MKFFRSTKCYSLTGSTTETEPSVGLCRAWERRKHTPNENSYQNLLYSPYRVDFDNYFIIHTCLKYLAKTLTNANNSHINTQKVLRIRKHLTRRYAFIKRSDSLLHNFYLLKHHNSTRLSECAWISVRIFHRELIFLSCFIKYND